MLGNQNFPEHSHSDFRPALLLGLGASRISQRQTLCLGQYLLSVNESDQAFNPTLSQEKKLNIIFTQIFMHCLFALPFAFLILLHPDGNCTIQLY